jgi:LmbE family N-acetylglucosaminyl deacetylase
VPGGCGHQPPHRPGQPFELFGLRRELVRAIRDVRPEVVVTWSLEWNWARFRSCHPDHRATGDAVLSAVYPDAGNRFAHLDLREEGLEP